MKYRPVWRPSIWALLLATLVWLVVLFAVTQIQGEVMIGLILTIAVVGVLVWLVVTYVPMPAPFKTIIMVVAVVVLILYLVGAFGLVDIPVPRLRR